MELVYGVHAVEALLRESGDGVQRILLASARKDRRLQMIADLAAAAGVPVQRVDRAEIERRAPGLRHQGVVAECRGTRAAPADLDAVLDRVSGAPLVLVLDGVQDPHNLGACLRTGEAAGVDLVIAPRDRAVGLTPAVRKVAAGAAERLPFVTVPNLARALRRLQERGLWLLGADAGGESLYTQQLRGGLALVMGAEGAGLRRLTREACDQIVSLPMGGRIESLNVAVAAGVCLYEMQRQRGFPGLH